MAVGTLAFLGLALLCSLWFPNWPAVAAILVVYAAHSAVHLVRNLRGADTDDYDSTRE